MILEVNDVIRVQTKCPKNPSMERNYVTVITWIEEREDAKGKFFYVGHQPINLDNGRFGAFRIDKPGYEKEYGTFAVAWVGKQYPVAERWDHGWMVGHPGYDLH